MLLAIGRSAELAHTALRLTLGAPTTDAEVERVLALLPIVVERVRGRSHRSADVLRPALRVDPVRRPSR